MRTITQLLIPLSLVLLVSCGGDPLLPNYTPSPVQSTPGDGENGGDGKGGADEDGKGGSGRSDEDPDPGDSNPDPDPGDSNPGDSENPDPGATDPGDTEDPEPPSPGEPENPNPGDPGDDDTPNPDQKNWYDYGGTRIGIAKVSMMYCETVDDYDEVHEHDFEFFDAKDAPMPMLIIRTFHSKKAGVWGDFSYARFDKGAYEYEAERFIVNNPTNELTLPQGALTVTVTGKTYTIDLAGTDRNGIPITVRYTGPVILETLD